MLRLLSLEQPAVAGPSTRGRGQVAREVTEPPPLRSCVAGGWLCWVEWILRREKYCAL